MPKHIWKAILYLILGYWIVTLLGIGTTYMADDLFHSPSPNDLGVPVTQSPAYRMTLPLHPLLNLLVWPWFAWVYLAGLPAGVSPRREMLSLGIFWTVITVAVDLIGWVLVPHPWQMTWAEFYLYYQPWLTLIYLAIFLSPLSIIPLAARLDAHPTHLETEHA